MRLSDPAGCLALPHPYPCRFPLSVASEFLPDRGTVFDPFCGSGTVLLAASLAGLDCVGVDCNPIARLVARCHLVDVDEAVQCRLLGVTEELERAGRDGSFGECDLTDFDGRDHWFSLGARREFGMAQDLLGELELESAEWTVVATAISSLVNRFSNQAGETRYVRSERSDPAGAIVRAIAERIQEILRYVEFRGKLSATRRHVYLGDVMSDDFVAKESIDRIITSPPYANTMDYYLYHKQRMNVLGLDYRLARDAEIGSRYRFSSRRESPEAWGENVHDFLVVMWNSLRKGGDAFCVIGDSVVSGEFVDAAKLVMRRAREIGFSYELLRSEAMSGRSRSFNHAFQARNKYEHVIALRKD